VKVFAVSDIGYNPYTTVLTTSGELLRKNPDLAKAMVAAVREGWRAYLDDPKAANQKMNALNPSMDAETFAQVAEVQKRFIETDATRRDGLGTMSRERWEILIAQFKELGDISQSIPADECFRSM
jgi:NitT/TauT family transport system substrate-binding protein